MTSIHERTLTERHTEYSNTNTKCRYTRLHTKYLSAPFFLSYQRKAFTFEMNQIEEQWFCQTRDKHTCISFLFFTFVSRCFCSTLHDTQRSAQNTNKYLKRVLVSLSYQGAYTERVTDRLLVHIVVYIYSVCLHQHSEEIDYTRVKTYVNL